MTSIVFSTGHSKKHQKLRTLLLSLLVIVCLPAHAQNIDLGGLLEGLVEAATQQGKQQNEGSAPTGNQQEKQQGEDSAPTGNQQEKQQGEGSAPPDDGAADNFKNWESEYDLKTCRGYSQDCKDANFKRQAQLCVGRLNALPISEESSDELERLYRTCRIGVEFGDKLREKREQISQIAQQRVKAERAVVDAKKKQLETEKNKVTQERQRKLRSGELKVQSMEDAALLVNADSLFALAGNPLLTPNGNDYKGDVRVDAQDGDFIRVLSELMGVQERRYPRYVYLKLSKKTVNFSPNNMRIGATVSIIGKYVKNINYRTTAGEIKTAPVIECSYLGKPSGEEARGVLEQMIKLR